jgi:hypothetical protein
MAAGGLGMMLIRLRRPMVVAAAILLVHERLAAPGRPRSAHRADLRLQGRLPGRGPDPDRYALHEVGEREIPAQVLSRVSAWDWMGSLAGMPLGFALTGPLLALTGERDVLYAMAAVALVLTVWMLAFADLRNIGTAGRAEIVATEA